MAVVISSKNSRRRNKMVRKIIKENKNIGWLKANKGWVIGGAVVVLVIIAALFGDNSSVNEVTN